MLFYLQHSGWALIDCCFSQQLQHRHYWSASLAVASPLRPQPGRNSVPAGAGSVAAAKDSFNQISIILFINNTQDSKDGVQTC